MTAKMTSSWVFGRYRPANYGIRKGIEFDTFMLLIFQLLALAVSELRAIKIGIKL